MDALIKLPTNTTMTTAPTIQFFGEQTGWLAVAAVPAHHHGIRRDRAEGCVCQPRSNAITLIIVFPLKIASYHSRHSDRFLLSFFDVKTTSVVDLYQEY